MRLEFPLREKIENMLPNTEGDRNSRSFPNKRPPPPISAPGCIRFSVPNKRPGAFIFQQKSQYRDVELSHCRRMSFYAKINTKTSVELVIHIKLGISDT